MHWFTNLKTRNKLFLAFAVLIVLLGTVILTAVEQARTIRQASAIARKIASMDGNVNEQRAAMLSTFVSEAADVRRAVELIGERKRENDQLLAEVRELYRGRGASQAALEEFVNLRNTHNETRDMQVIPLVLEGKLDEARKISLGVQSERYARLRDAGDRLVSAAAAEAEGATREAFTLFAVVGGVATVAAVLIAILLTRLIARPLDEMSAAAERIADGDLSFTLAAGSRQDEVGVLARAFSRMTD